MLLAEVVSRTYFLDLSAYPRWLVILVGTILGVLVLWLLLKMLKWTLWLLLAVVLVGGVIWAAFELLG